MKIGSNTFDHLKNPDIIDITVDLDLNVPLDTFTIILKLSQMTGDIRQGDPIIIRLGYAGDLSTVLTGVVDMIEPRLSELRITGYSLMYTITRFRYNKVYEKQAAGAIIKDIASSAGVTIGLCDDGINFPMYVVDDTKSAYSHMHELALRCGFDLYMTAEGKLVFAEYTSSPPRVVKYGRDIVSYEINEPAPVAVQVKIVGESPSSYKGAATSPWLSKKAVEGVIGTGGVTCIIEDPVIRDEESAGKVATRFLERMQVPLSGTVVTLGNARIRPSDTLELRETPEKRINRPFQVTRVSHYFNKTDGFISHVGWIEKVRISPSIPPLPQAPAIPTAVPVPSSIESQLAQAENVLEQGRLRLLDAIENGEMELEKALVEINSMISAIEKTAREMIAAAEALKKTAINASKDLVDKADELKKVTDEKKKELESTIKDVEKIYEDGRKEIGDEISRQKKKVVEAQGELENLKKEGKDKVSKIEDTAHEAIEKIKSQAPDAQSARAMAGELERNAKEEVDKSKNETEEQMKDAGERIRRLEEEVTSLESKEKETEKEVRDTVSEKRRVFEESVRETETRISEMKNQAKKIVEDADKQFEEIKIKAEKTRGMAIKKFETVKSTFTASREKILDARKQIGLD